MSPSGSDDTTDCTTDSPPTISATTSSASTSTHEVRITLSLSMSLLAFTNDKQTAFTSSLAQAGGIANAAVVTKKIESSSSRRNLLAAEALRVETSIMAAGKAAAGDSFSLGLSRKGATGVPLFTTWVSVAGLGRAPIPGNISGRSRPRKILSVLVAQLVGRLGSDGFWDQDYGWGVRVRRHLAHAGGALYGTELGSVTLKRIGFFCFPIKHSTHTH